MSVQQPLSARGGAREPAALEARAPTRRLLLAVLASIVSWGLLMHRFGSTQHVYAVMGPFALGVLLVSAALSSGELAMRLCPSWRAVSSGLAVGAAMTLATYPAYALLRSMLPAIEGEVGALYTAAFQTPLAEALPWVIAIIFAEEVLWRGALLHALTGRVSPTIALAISVGSYAAAQFATGSWIVMLLAVVCGTLWTLQRHFTRSLLSPLLAHLIWTPTVILFYPVTSL